MRIILVVLVTVTVLLGVSPYFIGGKIESVAQDYVEQLQAPGYRYSLEVARGYRSSRLNYQLEVDPDFLASYYALSDDQTEEIIEALSQFEIELQVQHGPLLTANGLGFGLADISMDIIPEGSRLERLSLTAEEALISARGRINFSGDGMVHYQIPATRFVDPGRGVESRFSGLEGELNFEGFGYSFTTWAASEGGLISMTDMISLEFGQMDFSAQMTMGPDYSWVANSLGSLQFEELNIDAAEFIGQLHQLDLGFAVTDGETSASSSIEYQIAFDDLRFNELLVEDGELSIAYENLGKSTMQNYMDLVANLPLNDAQAVDAALMQFALSEFPEALSHSPAIALPRLAFSHEGRTFEGRFRTSVDAQNLPGQISPLRLDLLLPALTAELSVDSDESLLNEILAWQAASGIDASLSANPDLEISPEMRQTMIDQQASMSLGMAVARGFALRENGRIRADLKLANRILDINGNAMPLPF